MPYKHIKYAVARGVACLTLNRPESLNSFTAAMHAEVAEVLEAAADDRAIRAVVITGFKRPQRGTRGAC